jgi:hypothetical protein
MPTAILKLVGHDDKPVWINLDRVISFSEAPQISKGPLQTEINISDSRSLYVKHTPEEIQDAIYQTDVRVQWVRSKAKP